MTSQTAITCRTAAASLWRNNWWFMLSRGLMGAVR